MSPFPKIMGNILMTGKNYLEQASILQTKYNDIIVYWDNGSDFTYEAIKKGDKLPLDSLNM